MGLTHAHILVVEDEKNVGSTLTERLRREGYEVSWALSQKEALSNLNHQKFDLALLDVGLPDGSGFDLAQIIKKESRPTALVFLTAFGNPEDRVRGLELGAEDYIVKPFHLRELLLRIQNGLKRAQSLSSLRGSQAAEALIGKALIRFDRFEAEVDGQTFALTHKECALLKFLVDHRGKVVSREEILSHVWSEDEYPSTRTIDNFIVRFRKMIEEDPSQPQWIKSVRGVGYSLAEMHNA